MQHETLSPAIQEVFNKLCKCKNFVPNPRFKGEKKMLYTDDPVRDFEAYDRQQQNVLDKYPVCEECGNPITDEDCYEVEDSLICEQCLKDNHKKKTDNYIKEF